MNSAVQCLANVPALRDRFLDGAYKAALKLDGSSEKSGSGGKIAEGFEALLQKLWSEDAKPFLPKSFKSLVGDSKLGGRGDFNGFRQHDSMEFIEFLIEGLQEDCNMVKGKKPYVERKDANGRPDEEVALEVANGYVLRNDSFVDDLFVGFMRTTTTCSDPTCGQQSVVFEPYLSIRAPLTSLARENERLLRISTVPVAIEVSAVDQPVSIAQREIWVKKGGIVQELFDASVAESQLNPGRCRLAEVKEGRVEAILEGSCKLTDVKDADTLVLYELEDITPFQSEEPTRDSEVIVVHSFVSNNKESVNIPSGTRGKIIKIDQDGDAYVLFEGIGAKQWVFKRNLVNLFNIDSPELRRLPSESKALTFRELEQAPEAPEELVDVWLNHMEPTTPGICHLHFRRAGQTDLFGIPLLFCVRRNSTGSELLEAVRAELQKRFGDFSDKGWRLFQADSPEEVNKADKPIEVEARRPAQSSDRPEASDNGAPKPLPLSLREKEYFVVEWQQDDVPESIAKALDRAVGLGAGFAGAVDLETCFEWHGEEQSGIEKYCSKCKQHREDFLQKLDIWSLPPVLVVHIKRFEFTSGMIRKRLSTKVNFPLEGLDLSRFCISANPSVSSGSPSMRTRIPQSFPRSCVRAGQRVEIHGLQTEAGSKLNNLDGEVMYFNCQSGRFCVRLQEDDAADAWKKVKPTNLRPAVETTAAEEAPPPVYDLMGVCSHSGSSNLGHYVAYQRSISDGVWRCYNDEQVEKVSAEEVAAQRSGAYVLFYLRREIRPASWGPPSAPSAAAA